MECSCRSAPSPGIYAIPSTLFVNRTLATLRSAEFGFLGVVVYTRVQTPRRCGQASKARDFDFVLICSRPLRTNCCIVGIAYVSNNIKMECKGKRNNLLFKKQLAEISPKNIFFLKPVPF